MPDVSRTRLRHCSLALLAALTVASAGLAPHGAVAQTAAGSCRDDTVTIQRGDTLSAVAARCDVSEADLIVANAGLLGSGDLQIGASIRTKGIANDSWLLRRRLGEMANDAGSAIDRFAGNVDSSLRDLLDKNPDLRSRLSRLGSELGLKSDQPAPTLTFKPAAGAPGSDVALTASGLPKDSDIIIGAGPPHSAYTVLTAARTSAAGTLNETVKVPDWLAGGTTTVFVVRSAEHDVTARSGRFELR